MTRPGPQPPKRVLHCVDSQQFPAVPGHFRPLPICCSLKVGSTHVNTSARNVLPWRLLERLSAYKHTFGLLFCLIVFVVALLVCWRMVREISFSDLRRTLSDVPATALLLAVLAACGNYAMLICYEWSAARYAGVKLRPSDIIFGGVCAFAVSNAVGVSMLSGGAVRCRLYFPRGLGATDVLRMSAFAALSLGCALPLLVAAAALTDLPHASAALGFSARKTGLAAGAVILFYLVALVFVFLHRTDQRPTPHTRIFTLGRWSLRLPGARLAFWQLCITLLDVVCAAAILYVLLPVKPPLAAFLLIYPLAVAAGVLSHVPGGLGVFEAVILTAFASEVGAVPLAAALLLYRVIYILFPLVLVSLILLGREISRLPTVSGAIRSASGFTAPIMALLVFCVGIVLLFSNMTPAAASRLRLLDFVIPSGLISLSHFASSLVGVLCLLLARGLRRRLASARNITIILLLAGCVLCLVKGLDWLESAVLLGIALLLWCFRDSFYRKSRLDVLSLSPKYIAACLCVLAASVWLMFFAYRETPYSNQLWWQFELDANVPRALRAALGSALLLGCAALAWLLKPSRPLYPKPDRTQLEAAHVVYLNSQQPEGGLVMSGDKSILFNDSGTAFIMYARQRHSLVALFDPIGPPLERADLIWQFRDLCDQHYLRPVFYQVRAANLPYYMDIGMTAIKLGEEALVDLPSFDLGASAAKDLRYTWNRCQRDGLTFEIHKPGEAPLDELRHVSDDWLANKHGKEKGFSLGRFSPDYLRYFRIAAVRQEGRLIAFASLLETEKGSEAGLDIMRLVENAHSLTMTFMMVGLILEYKEREYNYFSLGMAPLAGLHPRRGAPLSQRLGAIMYRYGDRFYSFQGLHRFKDKFATIWHPRYLAVGPGLDLPLALADATMLISGGLPSRDGAPKKQTDKKDGRGRQAG